MQAQPTLGTQMPTRQGDSFHRPHKESQELLWIRCHEMFKLLNRLHYYLNLR